jgi:sulfate transport system ATP-binding protein
MLRVGFEVRLTVRPAGAAEVDEVAAPGEEDEVTVVLTRSHARELDLDVGSRVWLSANRGATVMPVIRAV